MTEEERLYDLRTNVQSAQYNTDLMAAALGCSDWTHGNPPDWHEAELSANAAITALSLVLIEIRRMKEGA